MKKLRNTKKLIVAASALAVAVAVSAGATFAWFTTNSQVSVGSINASVTSGGQNNIMVALGHGSSNVEFKTTINSKDIENWLDEEYTDGVEFDAITYGSQTTGEAVAFKDVEGDPVDSTSGKYIKIPLTIRTDESDTIILQGTSTVTTSSTVTRTTSAWETINANTYGNHDEILSGTEIEAYACNATRVGFTTGSGTITNSLAPTESTLKVWSPNEARYDGAQTDGSIESGLERTAVTGDTTGTNYWKNNLAAAAYNAVSTPTKTISCEGYGTNYITTYAEKTTGTANIATTAQYENSTSYYAFIYVYIWLEGTDGDCFNSVLEQEIDVTLSLTSSLSLSA
ncbi:MAG: hypothetical protein LUI60_07575 [Clostridia bacterium]|nr:hypothetical protein [Clostridia bacterium]